MNCNIIKDLIPLYIDNCCSEESRYEIERHLKGCSECKNIYDEMNQTIQKPQTKTKTVKFHNISILKASVLQTVLFFISFTLITVGVTLEALTPYDFANGYAAFSLVIPSTGFMLSLTNWYFIRFYKNRRSFSKYSCLVNIAITVCAFILTEIHYGISVIDIFRLLKDINIQDTFISLSGITIYFLIGIILSIIFVILSKCLSNKYAKLLGKE